MRCITKVEEPAILRDNAAQWLQDFLADPQDGVKRYRYRHPQIKSSLKLETCDKCIYCESRIGHNTPGDIEHKVPTAKDPNRHFQWSNLSIACTECNRRKNDFYSEHDGFLDPYEDNIDDFLEHHGPVVVSKTGAQRGEVCVNILELCSPKRLALVSQKILKLTELQNLLERFNAAQPGPLKEVLKRQLVQMASVGSEYSAMVRAALIAKGYGPLLDPPAP
ncbi:MAG: HNH endonuclease [Proteobacteria bacterium]|nr:HNH endonuclease [Pseudomonadota bacterium]